MKSSEDKTTTTDPTSVSRKKDHIELAIKSQTSPQDIDNRFYYEPILSGHPDSNTIPETKLLRDSFQYPLWVSSMTGGTTYAKIINTNLAKACAKYNLGMGLGSCRSLLYSDKMLDDFAVRKVIGDRPLYANLGIAQIEELINDGQLQRIDFLLDKLSANGLIIHINPLQEWLQPEGDYYSNPPLESISRILEHLDAPIIVKEVGQGMGIESIKALLALPIQAIDFAANGGTNFSKLELLRGDKSTLDSLGPLVNVGHSAIEMVQLTNQAKADLGEKMLCKEIIVSGGIKNFLDGYHCIQSLELPAIYGQASSLLKYAKNSFEELDQYISLQIEGLKVAYSFIRIKTPSVRK